MGRFLLPLLGLGLGATTLWAQPVITQQPTDQIILAGSNGAFNVTASGTGPFIYQWQFNGTNLPNTNAITTVAGNGSTGFNGDGGQATNATLYYPSSITFDKEGNLYIADSSNRRIRKVDTNGVISTLAGTGSIGHTGDGGPATSATLGQPEGVAADKSGNVFISDFTYGQIRMVDTNGNISTYIGTNATSALGDGGPVNLGTVYGPRRITFDAIGNMLIGDYYHSRIRLVDTNGIIYTVAGTNAQGFTGDGGSATNARLSTPYGASTDRAGNILIADTYNSRIRKVDTNGMIVTVAGTNYTGFAGDGGNATVAQLSQPSQVIADAFGNLLIADSQNHRIRMVDTNGVITSLAGTNSFGFSGDGKAATNTQLNFPADLALNFNGDLLFADRNNHRIRKINLTGSPMLNLKSSTTNRAGYYQVVIVSPNGSETSSIVKLSVVATVSPQNVIVTNGNTATLSVAAYGPGSFGYQWFFNTNTALEIGTNASLVLTNLVFEQRGSYYCVVSNNAGSVTSSVISLTVTGKPPTITIQPNYPRVLLGGATNIGVSATGDPPLGYQWFISSARTATAYAWIGMAGQVQYAFITDSGMGYVSTPQVRFIGGSGSGATAVASRVNDFVLSISVLTGGSGYGISPPTVQIDPPPMVNTPLINQTNSVLSFPAASFSDMTNYFVVITNNYGSITSSASLLTVFLSPQNFSIQNVLTGLQMNLTGSANFPYVLQSATNLTSPVVWKSIRTNYSDASGIWKFIDTNLNGGQKFYRALGQ